MLNSSKVDLLDHPRLIGQIVGLERRVARSGHQSIDHPPGAHDDLANAVCGALLLAVGGQRPLVISQAVLARSARPDRAAMSRNSRFFF
jgi:hypothetical protein